MEKVEEDYEETTENTEEAIEKEMSDEDFDPIEGDKRTKEELRAEKEALKRQLIMQESMNRQLPCTVRHERGGEGDNSYDLSIHKVSVNFGGKTLLEDSPVRLAYGRKYGLIGRNGIGKTCFMNFLARGEFEEIPKHLQILLVEQEISQNDKSILNTVLETDVERDNLLKEEQEIINSPDKDTKRLQEIYRRLDEIDAKTAQSRARKILAGLGFRNEKLDDPMKSLSGGWRMRVALARALFVKPDILLLDEPTNHLDLDAVIWLEEYIQECDNTIVVVSHDRSFLNNVCTDIIHFFNRKLHYYKGNYDQFEMTRNQVNTNIMKQYDKQQAAIEKSQAFIDKFRANNKRASMVQSKIKQLAKVEVIERVITDPSIHFRFPKPDIIKPPCLKLEEGYFTYDEDSDWILEDVNFAVDMTTRISIVGANGAGKSTLLKLLTGKLSLTQGDQYKNPRLKVSMFTQHHIDQLDVSLTPLEQLQKQFPGVAVEKYRQHLSAFGIINKLALQPIYTLSGGQKSRVAFAMSAWSQPHIMILDEPTNHLDLDAVNALIEALNHYEGGIVIVSHDEHLIRHVCEEIWYVKDARLTKFEGTFQGYREALLAGEL